MRRRDSRTHGAVYKLDTIGKFTLLYKFTGPTKGGIAGGPNGGVFLGPTGYLYGTTTNTGIAGAVFKVNTASHESKLYDLPGAPGGSNPFAGVIMDSAGNLYGTAAGGTAGAGVVYKFDSAGRETVLYTFTGGGDGRVPNALVRDSAGNLYGTTKWGGASDEGVVYKLDPWGSRRCCMISREGPTGASQTT